MGPLVMYYELTLRGGPPSVDGISISVGRTVVTRSLRNTDTDDKNNTEVSVFQYVFEIRSISISI